MNSKTEHCAEVILTLRRRRQSQARQEFVRARLEMMAVRSAMEQLQENFRRQTSAVRSGLLKDSSSGCDETYRAFASAVRGRMADHAAMLEEAKRRMQDRREKFVESIKRLKASSTLQERLAAARQAAKSGAEARELEAMHALHAAQRAMA